MKEFKGIFVEGTVKTPQIDFNQLSGELILSGKSIPENAAKIYEPLLFWIHEYIKSPVGITNFRLNLEYFNSSSLIWISKMVKALSRIDKEEAVLYIHLYFDTEDFEDTDADDIKDIIASLVDNIDNVKVSICIKAYGTDNDGKIIRESTILI